MKIFTRNLLAIALTACIAPMALAQSADAGVGVDIGAQVDTTTEQLDRVADTAMPPPVNDADPTPVDAEVDAMTRTEMNAAPPTDAAQVTGQTSGDTAMRTSWAELDADGDGRISTSEGSVDTDFNAGFEMMDTDEDGFVSRAEFDAHAKAHGERDDGMEMEEEDE